MEMRIIVFCGFTLFTAHALLAPSEKGSSYRLVPLVEDLPQHILEIGDQVFGSRQGLREALRNMADPHHVQFAGVSLMLTSAAVDNTLSRLVAEMSGTDHYGISKVTADQGVIVDVGSNVGDFAISAALSHPHMTVIAVEPSPHTFFHLLLNMHMNKVPLLSEQDLAAKKAGVFAVNAAITKDGRDVKIHWSDANTQNAAVDTNEPSTRGWKAASVPSFQMDKFLSSHGIDSVELFKIDCEGCEFEVIPSMREIFVDKNKVRRVAGEIHQSLKTSERTDARKATQQEKESTDALLAQRGCAVGAWKIAC